MKSSPWFFVLVRAYTCDFVSFATNIKFLTIEYIIIIIRERKPRKVKRLEFKLI